MRPFRRRPPEPRPTSLLRARLLAALLARFEQRVTTVVAPAGYGKTTLLAQALAENALAPRGVDIWLSCEPADAEPSVLVDALARALGRSGPSGARRHTVVDGVWSRAPLPVVLILDDVHEIPAGSPGAAALAQMITTLPENGHVVLAGRADPPVPLTRLMVEGRVTALAADDLLLSTDEQAQLARLLHVDPSLLTTTGGWPALAQLTATAGRAIAERYVWEEVLATIGPTARRVLGHLTAIGGADTELASAVLQEPVDLDKILRRAPLVDRRRGARGPWFVPHDLWRPIVAHDLDAAEAAAARRRAASVLRERGELRRAGELLLTDPVDDAAWPDFAALIVDGTAIIPSLSGANAAEAWLAAVPPSRRNEPEAHLLAGVTARGRGEAVVARAELEAAVAGAEAQGRRDTEIAALSQLAHVAWWSDDLLLLAQIVARVRSFDAATPLAMLGAALTADTAQDPAGALGALDDFSSDSPELSAAADFLRARALLALGRADDAIGYADRAATLRPPLPAAQIQALVTRWQAGHAHDVASQIDQIVPGETAQPRDRLLTNLSLAYAYCFLGRLDAATACVDEAKAHVTTVEGIRPALFTQVVEAVVTACRGEEDRAVEQVAGLSTDPSLMTVLRVLMPALYVLRPDLRAPWDATALGPDHAEGRAAARALVDARDGRRQPHLPRPTPPRVLAALGFRWGIELAARTDNVSLAGYLLAHCGEPARRVLRILARELDGARRLLRTVPLSSGDTLRIRVLGPPALERGGVEIVHPDWRRERVRSLLSLLVARRRVTRSEVQGLLWPDLDEVAGAANLRTTLNYLHKLLEPHREIGDATFHVRVDGDALQLEDQCLAVDAWELEAHLDEAALAEVSGSPSLALRAYQAALALWRGDYLEGVYDDWAQPERDRLRARFLAASVRAGELLVAEGDPERALTIATRAVETEPWSEPAHRLTVAAHLARGDRASARRALDRCRAAVAELGVAPAQETVMLERTVMKDW